MYSLIAAITLTSLTHRFAQHPPLECLQWQGSDVEEASAVLMDNFQSQPFSTEAVVEAGCTGETHFKLRLPKPSINRVRFEMKYTYKGERRDHSVILPVHLMSWGKCDETTPNTEVRAWLAVPRLPTSLPPTPPDCTTGGIPPCTWGHAPSAGAFVHVPIRCRTREGSQDSEEVWMTSHFLPAPPSRHPDTCGVRHCRPQQAASTSSSGTPRSESKRYRVRTGYIKYPIPPAPPSHSIPTGDGCSGLQPEFRHHRLCRVF